MDTREVLKQEVREEMLAAQRAYKKEWRKRNPDKVRKHNETYWLKKAAEMKGAAEHEKQSD